VIGLSDRRVVGNGGCGAVWNLALGGGGLGGRE